jgi:hypothetical protein
VGAGAITSGGWLRAKPEPEYADVIDHTHLTPWR